MKEKVTGGFTGIIAVLYLLISYVAFITPAIVVSLHFGFNGFLTTILVTLYVAIISGFPLINEIVMILGAIFAYSDFPLSFFIVYCIVFGLFTIVTIFRFIFALVKN